MAVNRVDYGGKTLIDLTGDTLESAEQLLKGIIAHAKDGSVITGQMEAGGGGGGLPAPFTAIKTGTFTLASLAYCNAYPINHGLGVNPTIFALYNDVEVTKSGSVAFVFYINHSNANANKYGGFCNSKDSNYGILGLDSFIVDENSFTFNKSAYYYGSNRQFRWVALG